MVKCHLLKCYLLIPLLILLSGGFLFSQTEGGLNPGGTSVGGSDDTAGNAVGNTAGEEVQPPLEVRIETSSANPMINNPWSLFVLVNHPSPQEVNVKAPRFPPSLVLERVRTETRTIEGNRWTRVEFLFTPQRVGGVTIQPFEVTVPGRQAVTGETNVRFREDTRTVKRYDPRFRWVTPTPSVPSGERGEIFLDLSGWDPAKNPPLGIFRGKTPQNAILEEKTPASAGDGVYRYAITFIPLEGSSVALGPLSFQAEGFSLTVPALKIPVLPPPAPADQEKTMGEENPGASIQTEGSPQDEIPPQPFPESEEKIFPLFREEYYRIAAGVRTLWDENQRTQALAEIRRNERDSLAGPFLVPLRREMEQALGLAYTDDERWRPLKIPLLIWVIFGFLILSGGVFLFVFHPRLRIHRDAASRNNDEGKSVTSRRRGGFRTVIVLVFSVMLVLIFLEESVGNFVVNRLTPPGKTAVLERTPAYRVPDLKGAVNAWFGEGQPVIVGDYEGDWCYAESSDGRSGWVPRTAVTIY